ncbi:MAG: hypothetical protein ONA90_10690 [candidate division KSB1 bacterium]|nr:hypothetical protein [candidate division KSB1 bacterium]
MGVLTLFVVGALPAVQVIDSLDAVKNCERLGQIVVGDQFVQMDRETLEQAIREEAERMRADKVLVNIIAHNHPKLGKQYRAKAVAWRCGQGGS